MANAQLRDLVDALAEPGGRAAAAQQLAARLGARRLLLFVLDPALQVLLPATGMPKTVAGGPLWRAFLRRCLNEARPVGTVDLAGEAPCNAQAQVQAGCAVILLEPPDPWPAELLDALPLLGAVLAAQQAKTLGDAEAVQARDAASRAHALAKALDAARASAAALNAQLHEEHRRKDEFLAMLAHELRNPLAPMVSALEILRFGGSLAEDAYRRQLDLMARQLHQLTHLVEDLLDVSRVSRGLIELRREPLRLDDILNEAVEACRPLLEQHRHTLQRSGAGGELHVNGDRVRLTQVFSNLLNNAAKYTDDGGQLQLSVVPDQSRVSVVLRDNGMGIPRDMLPRIFDMFTQVTGSLDRAQGGLGIGLTLVRTLLELHGGHISAHSLGPGHGSTFTVSLPLVAAPVRPPAPAEQAPPEVPSGVQVLVVDDNRDAAESLADVLRLMGAEAEVAHDGVQALALAAQRQPDLVLLDIGLPGIDGYETARQWRRRFGDAAWLVALTGYGSEQDKLQAEAAGFNQHLTKPISMPAIQRLLAQVGSAHAT